MAWRGSFDSAALGVGTITIALSATNMVVKMATKRRFGGDETLAGIQDTAVCGVDLQRDGVAGLSVTEFRLFQLVDGNFHGRLTGLPTKLHPQFQP